MRRDVKSYQTSPDHTRSTFSSLHCAAHLLCAAAMASVLQFRVALLSSSPRNVGKVILYQASDEIIATVQQGLYVCFGVAGNGAYVILWHASLPEISSSLCSNSSPAHPSRRVRVCPGTPRVQSFDLFCQGSQDLSRPRPIRDPGYIAMSAGSSRCLLTQSGVESCSPSDS